MYLTIEIKGKLVFKLVRERNLVSNLHHCYSEKYSVSCNEMNLIGLDLFLMPRTSTYPSA